MALKHITKGYWTLIVLFVISFNPTLQVIQMTYLAQQSAQLDHDFSLNESLIDFDIDPVSRADFFAQVELGKKKIHFLRENARLVYFLCFIWLMLLLITLPKAIRKVSHTI